VTQAGRERTRDPLLFPPDLPFERCIVQLHNALIVQKSDAKCNVLEKYMKDFRNTELSAGKSPPFRILFHFYFNQSRER
tara:strand:- start:94 stop:330 length:237 start_codon:yes stop_codon:yes gene_type:complete